MVKVITYNCQCIKSSIHDIYELTKHYDLFFCRKYGCLHMTMTMTMTMTTLLLNINTGYKLEYTYNMIYYL